ncbi:hypothetical protein [Streptomyces aidingensis]|uniref:Uncharacterized protein n=1 Tax=Streptomyces aidingensis TaxID=910347 RepID=A0A1I1L7C0_9ACTN|nr:hypothetical protein [Streptomyces aidingensis]SFC68382.1 hypothetical protein SAMN05421773_10565 [Streptomyces aidingensis]
MAVDTEPGECARELLAAGTPAPGTLLTVVWRDRYAPRVGRWCAQDLDHRARARWLSAAEGGHWREGYLVWQYDGRVYTAAELLAAIARAAGAADWTCPRDGAAVEDWLVHAVSGRTLRHLWTHRPLIFFGGPWDARVIYRPRECWPVRHCYPEPDSRTAAEWGPAEARSGDVPRYVPEYGPRQGDVCMRWAVPAAAPSPLHVPVLGRNPTCPSCALSDTWRDSRGWVHCRHCGAVSY